MRTYKKTYKGTTAQERFIDTAKEVIQSDRSFRTVASNFNVNFITLQIFCKRKEKIVS